MDVIALDIGRSTVKIAVPEKQLILPTAVIPAVDAGRLEVGDSAEEAKRDTVELDGKLYFIGETAKKQAKTREPEGLFKDWIETQEHKAILKGAYLRAIRECGAKETMVMLGLPSDHFYDQKDRLAEVAAMTLQLPLSQIKVVPQAFGAYMALMLDKNAAAAKGRSPGGESWGVIDIGFYTTDFGILDRGSWLTFASESVSGTHKAGEHLTKLAAAYDIRRGEADDVLRAQSTRHNGKVVDLSKECELACDTLADEILRTAKGVFGDRLPRFDGILVAGGGAEVVFQSIKKHLPHAETIPNARLAIAEGMRRYGLGLVQRSED